MKNLVLKKLTVLPLITFILLTTFTYALAYPNEQSSEEYNNPNVVIHEVPNNFDPLKATDEELEFYNYPARPKGSQAELDEWKSVVAPGNRWIKPKFAKTNIESKIQKGDSIVKGISSANWSGVVSTSTTERVVGWWNVPRVTADTTHNPSYSGHWVGLGAGNGGNQLIQAGTLSVTSSSGSPLYYCVYEIVGTDKQTPGAMQLTNVPVSYGNSMYVDISFHVANTQGIASFYIYNQTTGAVTSFSITGFTNYSTVRSTAEGIAERPTVNGSLPFFANYNYCNFIVKRSSTYNGTVSPLNNIVYWQIINPQNQVIGTTSTYNSSTASYTTYWNGYN